MKDVGTVWKITAEDFEQLTQDYGGICLACGELQESGIEPDARRYQCPDCGARAVYGAEEALLMGRIDMGDE